MARFWLTIQRIWRALETSIDNGMDLRIRVAALELDLRERDEEIRQLREEYARHHEQAARQRHEAAMVSFENLARQLALPLSQLVTMRALAAMGRPVCIEDILTLCDKLEQLFTKSGLSCIGTVGATAKFNPCIHQQMGGINLHENDAVTIRFVGYRLHEIILLKAMVSAVESNYR